MKKKSLFILLFIFSLKHFGQVGIGTEDPHPSAILDLNSSTSSQGVLLPRVALTSETDVISVPNPATGLLVYNTGEDTNFPLQGYMFWNGEKWRFVVDGAAVQPEILGNITSTLLTPNQYNTAGNYLGYLEVRYTGGSGGYYLKGEPYIHDGLTYELQPGKLESSGTLVYKVTGRPPVNHPNKIPQVPIIFSGTELGREDIGGGASTVESAQYTLYEEIDYIATGVNGVRGIERGYGGSLMKWGKSGELKEIVLPESGSYSFSFRLYGEATDVSNEYTYGEPFYIAGFKQKGTRPELVPSGTKKDLVDELLDISVMTIEKPADYSKLTYSINLTISGEKGDKIYFTIAGIEGASYSWLLKNGNGDDKVADRTSMIFWKL